MRKWRIPGHDKKIIVPAGPRWNALRRRLLILHSKDIFSMVLLLAGKKVMVSGDVASGAARAAILAVITHRLPGLTIVDSITVTAPFEPAQNQPFGWDDAGDKQGGPATAGAEQPVVRTPTEAPRAREERPPADRLVLKANELARTMTIERYPSIVAREEPRAGQELIIEIDLGLERDSSTGGRVDLANVAEDWTELGVTVQVLCAEAAFDDPAGEIVLRRDGHSEAATFRGVVAEDSRAVNVRAVFFFEGRYSGAAQRSFAVGTEMTSPTASPASVRLESGAKPPTLTVSIEASASNVSTWMTMSSRIVEFNRSEEVRLGDLDSFLGPLLEEAPGLPVAAMRSRLRGKGEELWRIAPPVFKEVYLRHRERFGADFPMQFVTDIASVPWEMMHPGGSFDHLFMTHPVARWVFGPAFQQTFSGGQIASFVPSYGESTLPAATAEGRWLESRFGARPHAPTYADFMKLLCSPSVPTAMVHFAGHGSTTRRGLEMEGREWVSADDLNSGVELGRRDHCLVVLNACEMADQKIVFDAVSGWPDKLAALGFGGVLAPLWSVQDEVASRVVKDSVEHFLSGGLTLGEAIRKGRIAHRGESSTPYAYIIYGDVMARLATDASWPPEPR